MKEGILLGVLVVCSFALFFMIVFGKPYFTGDVVSEGMKFANTLTCTDSDEGVFSFVKGDVSAFNFLGIQRKYQDRCSDTTYLQEQYCDNGKAKSQMIACMSGCDKDKRVCNEILVQPENVKDMSKYAEREVFLVSNKDWHDVLPLVPVTTWTGSEKSCTRGYGTPENVCVYPTLIWHDETSVEKKSLKLNKDSFTIKPSHQLLNIISTFPSLPLIEGQSHEITIYLTNNELTPVQSYVDLEINPLFSLSSGDEKIRFKSINLNLNIGKNTFYVLYDNKDLLEFKPGESKVLKLLVTLAALPQESFDVDSSIYFMQQYQKDGRETLTLVGSTPLELDQLLVAKPELGVGLSESNIKRIASKDYLSYWKNYHTIIYTEDDYQTALLASSYASLLNAPLIIKGTLMDRPEVFNKKKVFCVGNVDFLNGKCEESYTLVGLRKKYLEVTSTKNIVLVNPSDIIEDKSLVTTIGFKPEKSSHSLGVLYAKTSLSSPFLASAKHQLLLSTISKEPADIDAFIEQTTKEIELVPDYLTILASPKAINMAYKKSFDEYSADAYQYSNIDNKGLLDIAVGRIFAHTSSDVSSYIARDLFYDKLIKNPEKVITTVGSLYGNDPAIIHSEGKVFSSLGYTTTTIYDTDKLKGADFKNNFFVSYRDHGSYDWAGFDSRELPYLDHSFIVSLACLTCAFEQLARQEGSDLSQLFCSQAIRKGAIGYIGTVDASGDFDSAGFFADVFAEDMTIGKAFINTKNLEMVKKGSFDNVMGWYTLIGDPTFKLPRKYTMPRPASSYTTTSSSEVRGSVSVPAMKIEIPLEVKKLYGATDKNNEYVYFMTHHNIYLTTNGFSFILSLKEAFTPKKISEGYNFLIVDDKTIGIYKQPTSKESEDPFKDAREDKFTTYNFDFSLSSQAPDPTPILPSGTVIFSGSNNTLVFPSAPIYSIVNISFMANSLLVNVTNIGKEESKEVILKFSGKIDGKKIPYYSSLFFADIALPKLKPGEIHSLKIQLDEKDIVNGGSLDPDTYYVFVLGAHTLKPFDSHGSSFWWAGEVKK